MPPQQTAVSKAVRMHERLLLQQPQRRAGSVQLTVHRCPVRLRPPIPDRLCRRRENRTSSDWSMSSSGLACRLPRHIADLAPRKSRSTPVKRSRTMPIRGSPNGARHRCPQVLAIAGARVAINRNGWSRSIGVSGRDHPVRATPATTNPFHRLLSAPCAICIGGHCRARVHLR
jgi:hypothetical protein